MLGAVLMVVVMVLVVPGLLADWGELPNDA